MAFTKKRLTPVVNLVADPLFNFSNPYLQNGVIAGQYYTNEQTSYGLPKPSYLQITENSNTVTVVATAAEPLKIIFAYGIHDANTGGQIGAWRTFTAGVISNTALVATASNTSWVYAEVNENGEPSNPNVWTIDMGIEHSVGRTYTTSNVRPPAPQNGDVWFDFANNTLERYDSSIPSWQIKRRVYLGEVSKGGDDYLYSVQTWFPDRAWAEYQDQYYPPYYENPWRHFDGVSFTTNGQYISSQADSWKANDTIVQAVTGNKIAMNAIANSAVGQQLVGNSNLFLNYAANSTVALSSIANSAIAANLSHQLLANAYIALSNNLVVNSIASFTNSITGPILATGGNTVTDVVDGDILYRVHTFTGSGTFTVHSVGNQANTIEYLIVAGGGGGAGDHHSGGGGAGGLLQGNNFPVSIGSYPIIVGSGGIGHTRVASAPLGPTGPVSFPAPAPIASLSGANSSAFGFQAMGGGGGDQTGDAAYYANAVAAVYVNSSNTGSFRLGGSGGGSTHSQAGSNPWVSSGNGIIGQGHSGGGWRRVPFWHRGVQVGDTRGSVAPAQGLFPGNYPAPPLGPHIGGVPSAALRPHHGATGNGGEFSFFPGNPGIPSIGSGVGWGGSGGGGAGGDGHWTAYDTHHTAQKFGPSVAGDGGKGIYSRISGVLTGYGGGGGGSGYWQSQTSLGPTFNSTPPTVMNKTRAEDPANNGIGTEGGGTSRYAPGNTSLNPTLTFIKADNGVANRGGGGGAGGGSNWGPFGNPPNTYSPNGPVWYAPGGYANGGNGGSGVVIIRYPIAKNADRWNKPGKLNVQYLIVAGGGGSGNYHSGGGGAGGFRTNVPGQSNGGGNPLDNPFEAIEGILYNVTVGAGGTGTIGPSHILSASTKGNDSVFGDRVAFGGGAAQAAIDGGSSQFGGSGAGGRHAYHEQHHYGPVHQAPAPTGHHGTPGPQYGPSHFRGNSNRSMSVGLQGYRGGHGATNHSIVAPWAPINSSCHAQGGGGGAGAVGANVPNDQGATHVGAGGNGLASPITGTPVIYAGGGGGGNHHGVFGSGPLAPLTQPVALAQFGLGGSGGGGDGAYAQLQNMPTSPHAATGLFGVIAKSGQANRGGGGGGGTNHPTSNWGNTPTSGLNAPAVDAPTTPLRFYGRQGGSGGSGIVIIRIPRTHSAIFSPGCTVANSTSVADFFVYSVTATSSTSETVKFVRNT